MKEFEIELRRQGQTAVLTPEDYISVEFPNTHTAIDEFTIELPPSEQWEWWAQQEGSIMTAYLVEEGGVDAADPIYSGRVDYAQTNMEGDHPVRTTTLRGQDVTAELRTEGGADRRFQSVLGWEAIQTYVNNELDSFDWTVVEPNGNVVYENNQVQFVDTGTEFGGILDKVETASGTYDLGSLDNWPFQTTSAGLQTQQAGFMLEGADDAVNDSADVYYTGSSDRADNYSNGTALGLGTNLGSYAEWEFTNDYTIPAGAFDLWYRTEANGDSTNQPQFDILIDGGAAVTSTSPSSNLGWSSNLNPDNDIMIEPGTHTIRIETVSTGDVEQVFDLLHVRDSRFDWNKDDSLHEPQGYVDSPGLYPNGCYVHFDPITVATDISRGVSVVRRRPFVPDAESYLTEDGSTLRPSDGLNQSTHDQRIDGGDGYQVDVSAYDRVYVEVDGAAGGDAPLTRLNDILRPDIIRSGNGGEGGTATAILDVSGFDYLWYYTPKKATRNGYWIGSSANNDHYRPQSANGPGSAAITDPDDTVLFECGGGGGGRAVQYGFQLTEFESNTTYTPGSAGAQDVDTNIDAPNTVFTFSLNSGAIDVHTHDVSETHDIANRTGGSTQSFSPFSESTGCAGHWGDSGSKLYLLGEGNVQLQSYDVSTNFDASTASAANTLDLSTWMSQPRDIEWGDGGNVMVAVDAGGQVHRFVIEGTAWTLTDLVHDTSVDYTDLGHTGLTSIEYDIRGYHLTMADRATEQILELHCEDGRPWTIDESNGTVLPVYDVQDISTASAIRGGEFDVFGEWYHVPTGSTGDIGRYEFGLLANTSGDGGGQDGSGGSRSWTGDADPDGGDGQGYVNSTYGTQITTTTGGGVNHAEGRNEYERREVDFGNIATGELNGVVEVNAAGGVQSASPRYNHQSQTVELWDLTIDQTDVVIFNDRSYTGSDFENLRDMHQDAGLVFTVSPVQPGNQIPAETFVPDERTRPGDWREISHRREIDSRGYANIQRAYGSVVDGQRLEVTVRSQSEIDQVGEHEAEPLFRPNIANEIDLEAEARRALADRIRNGDRVRGPVQIVPQLFEPGYAYQVDEFDDERVLETVTFLSGPDGPTADLTFETTDDFLDVVSSLQSDIRRSLSE